MSDDLVSGSGGQRIAAGVALGALSDGVAARDLEETVALFTEDAVLFGSGADEQAHGTAAIRAMLEGLFALPFSVHWEWDPPVTGGSDDFLWFVTTGELVFSQDGTEQRRTPYRLSGVLVESDEGYCFALFNGSEPVD